MVKIMACKVIQLSRNNRFNKFKITKGGWLFGQLEIQGIHYVFFLPLIEKFKGLVLHKNQANPNSNFTVLLNNETFMQTAWRMM